MALASIIPPSNRVPGIFLKVSLGVGARTALDATRKVLIVGNKLSGGTAAVELPYLISGPDDAATYFGRGSELHMMAIAAFAANPSVVLYAIAITASGGTAASGTLVFASSATSAGTCRVWVRGEMIEIPVANGDAAATVAAAVEAAIDDQTDWPVTAGVVSGTVTVTAKHAGPRGNHIALRAELVDVTGLTVTPPAGGFLTSGATSDAPANAIAAAAGDRYYYYALPYTDSVNLALFETSLDSLDEPENGKRAVYVAACIDTPANAITLATGQNFARGQIAWAEGSEDYPGCIAAALAAYRARYESSDPAANISGEEIPGLHPSPRPTDVPTGTELQNAINNGLTPIAKTAGGGMRLVRNCTTRTLDADGNPDYRVLDAHKVSVADFVADDLEVFLADRFRGFKLADDDPDGELPPNGVATPATIKDAFAGRLVGYDAGNPRASVVLLENTEDNLAQLVVERATAPAGRVNASVPIDVIDHLLQIGADVRQVG